jgi:hypothetical protein
MSEKKSTIEEVTASGCTFFSGYILLAIALFADSPILLILGAIILLASSFLIRKLDPVILKGCTSSGIFTFFWTGFIAACQFWQVNFTARLFAVLISPAGLFLSKILWSSGTEISKGFAYLKKSHQEIKDLHSK